jgi:hypothetical protein
LMSWISFGRNLWTKLDRRLFVLIFPRKTDFSQNFLSNKVLSPPDCDFPWKKKVTKNRLLG